jgi:hypothetical protein
VIIPGKEAVGDKSYKQYWKQSREKSQLILPTLNEISRRWTGATKKLINKPKYAIQITRFEKPRLKNASRSYRNRCSPEPVHQSLLSASHIISIMFQIGNLSIQKSPSVMIPNNNNHKYQLLSLAPNICRLSSLKLEVSWKFACKYWHLKGLMWYSKVYEGT